MLRSGTVSTSSSLIRSKRRWIAVLPLSDHPQPEALGSFGHGEPDLAQTDDSEGLAHKTRRTANRPSCSKLPRRVSVTLSAMRRSRARIRPRVSSATATAVLPRNVGNEHCPLGRRRHCRWCCGRPRPGSPGRADHRLRTPQRPNLGRANHQDVGGANLRRKRRGLELGPVVEIKTVAPERLQTRFFKGIGKEDPQFMFQSLGRASI